MTKFLKGLAVAAILFAAVFLFMLLLCVVAAQAINATVLLTALGVSAIGCVVAVVIAAAFTGAIWLISTVLT